MPTETPALELGADANAKPPIASATKRSFLQFIVLPPTYSTQFKTRSFAILFNPGLGLPSLKSGVTANANVLAEPMVIDPIEVYGVWRGIGPAAGERGNRTARQDRGQVELHFIDEAGVQGLTKQVAAAFQQYARYISF